MSLPCCQPPRPMAMEILRRNVAELAHLATALDYLKNKFPDPMWKAALRRAVREMHGVATEIDAEHDFGIYAKEPDDVPA